MLSRWLTFKITCPEAAPTYHAIPQAKAAAQWQFAVLTCWLSLRITMTFLSRKPAWFIASYAMPPVMAPSPITAMQLFLRPCRHQGTVSQQWRSMGRAVVSTSEYDLDSQCQQHPGQPVFAQGRCKNFRMSLELARPLSTQIKQPSPARFRHCAQTLQTPPRAAKALYFSSCLPKAQADFTQLHPFKRCSYGHPRRQVRWKWQQAGRLLHGWAVGHAGCAALGGCRRILCRANCSKGARQPCRHMAALRRGLLTEGRPAPTESSP